MSNRFKTFPLPPNQWKLVAPVVAAEFGDGMPTDHTQTMFLTTLDKGNLVSFVRIERLLHFVCTYVAPAYRGTKLTNDTIVRAVEMIPPGFAGIWLTDRNRNQMAERLGARNIGDWTVYRKDVISL